MFVQLGCNSCNSELKIPIMIGGMYPNMESICKKCENGLLLVKGIQSDSATIPSSLSVKKTSITTKGIILNSEEIKELIKNDSPGGNQILTSFHNRISTIVVLVQLMDEIADKDRVLSVSKLVEEFNTISSQIRGHLKNVEEKLGVKRGEKLSDGYPEYNEANPGPMRIAHRNIIGTDGEHILFKRGIIQQMGLVEVVANSTTEFRLTEKANQFIDLPCLKSELLQLEHPELISNHPKLPNYFKQDTTVAILDVLFDAMPDERDWATHILEIISEVTKSSESGWDSNHYANNEASNCAQGQCHPRWSTYEGKTLFDKYLERADRQRKRKPESHAADRLEKFINGSLGGLLSRMKELGLIVPVRVGNTKNFKITGLGMEVLAKYSSKEVVA